MNTESIHDTALPAVWLASAHTTRSGPQEPILLDRPSPVGEAPVTVEDWIELSRQGNREAFGELVRAFEGRVYSFLVQFTGNRHDAEDLAQDTFVKAWRGMGSFKSSGSFSAWLFIIARRTALNHFRSRRHETSVEAPEGIDEMTPACTVEKNDESNSFWAIARKLKPAQYEALWLRYGEGFSVEETARVMRTNQIRVRVLLHRGRASLARLLDQRALREKGSR